MAKSLKGGLTNCPKCGNAVPVPGGPEGLFWMLLGGAVLFFAGIGALVWFTAGAGAGLVALGLGAIVILVGVLAS